MAPRRAKTCSCGDPRCAACFWQSPDPQRNMTGALKASSLVVDDTASPGTGLKIALIDPSLFTVPYDAKLAGSLGELGHYVTVYGEARRPGEEPTEVERLKALLFPELLRLGDA